MVAKLCSIYSTMNDAESMPEPLLLSLFLANTSFTYVLASPARLYIPQLFTHCLPTIMMIICITLVSIYGV